MSSKNNVIRYNSWCRATCRWQSLWRYFLLSLFLMCELAAGLSHAYAEPYFLEPEQAFQFSSRQIGPDKLEVTYQIADGYYMYRERFKFSADGASLGQPVIPDGKIKFDETFQKDVETYRKAVTITIPVISTDQSKPSFILKATSQGCSDQGLCYVPMESSQTFNTKEFLLNSATSSAMSKDTTADQLQATLHSGRLWIIMPLFMLLGIGLAFTPCVLPIVPILSSMIVGERGAGRHHGLILSLSYSLGMVIVYTALGIAAGLVGEGLAATLQNPWTLSVFAGLLVILSLSMFNVYHLQVPAAIQSKLASISSRQKSGKILSVFVMGAISALIVGPCVAAPLASALLYISHTRDVLIGGSALFALGVGMSVPLILVGVSAGALLPRAGRWMEAIKQFFGVMMLALALWMVSPILPIWIQMIGWSALSVGYGVFLFRHQGAWIKMVALVFFVFGILELVGVTSGGREVFAPIAHLVDQTPKMHLQFMRIKSASELDAQLIQAKAQGRFVMLDFYADWCVACKEMDKLTFTNQRVQSELAQVVLLQVDVTNNTVEDRALLKRFNLFGPPGIIFFGLDSQESGRIIGFENADKFLNSLLSAMKRGGLQKTSVKS